MIPILNEKELRSALAKGFGATIAVCWITAQQVTISNQGKSIDRLQGQMFELQKTVIQDNTKALSEFNLITRNNNHE